MVDIPSAENPVLSASLAPSFDYTRSTGPVLGAFFTGLRDGRLLGVRDSRGDVHVPPVEFDPHTRKALTDLVEVGSGSKIEGEIETWTWVDHPTEVNQLDEPFAWVLVRFDGADTATILPLAATGPDAVSTGMRVRVRWAPDRTGSIHDIACLVPADAPTDDDVTPGPSTSVDDITTITTPVGLSVTHNAAPAESEFLRAIVNGRILGRRRSNGPEVYVPPRDYCPSDGVAMGEYVEVSDHGTVTTFAIVNVPFAGQKITPPYVTAYILLDGADVPIQHLILGCEASEVRMGMRVRAVWAAEGARPESMQAITHFEPSAEPDADPDTFSKHL